MVDSAYLVESGVSSSLRENPDSTIMEPEHLEPKQPKVVSWCSA